MKRYILLLSMLLAVCSSMAQMSHTKNGTTTDPNAQKILKQAAQKINGSAVSFTVTMKNLDASKKETARTTAKVLYHKGKYRVTMNEQTIYSDGKSIWHWNKEVNELTIDKVSATDDLTNPLSLLNGYEKNFKAKFIRTESNGASLIDLTPNKGKSYHKVRLIISANSQLVGMELHNYDGSRGEFHISDYKTGVKCSEKDFEFDAKSHTDVEIIDMR